MLNQFTKLRKITIYSLLLVVAYVITGKLGLMLALPPGYASAIFPPAGIAIAAVFVAGKKTLPAIFFGSLFLNAWVGYDANHQINITSIEVALLIALASTIQALVGGWWLKRKIGYPTSLDSPNDVVTFFVSAPFICLISATLSVSGLFALGLIENSLFVTSLASWWIGDSLGLIVMLPLTLVTIGRPRNIWKQRLTTVALPMMVTFALLVIIFVIVSRWERKESLIEFDALSNQVSEQLRIRFESQEAVQEQISALFSYRNYDTVSTNDFHHFVKTTLISYPMIYAIEWVPKVSQQDRNSFIKQRQQDFSTFDIRQFGSDKGMVTASLRDYYFPITYIEPQNDSTRAILGFDLASLPDRKSTIFEAINKKKAAASSPINLIIYNGKELGLLLMYPIQGTKQDGVLSTILKADSFFGELFTPTKKTLNIRLIDTKTEKALYDGFADNQTEALYKRNFEFGGRQYQR